MAVPRNRLIALVVMLASVALAGQQAPPPAVPAAPAQQPDPQMPPITFRSEVNYVEVDAVVRDAQGNFVRDLTGADFQVFEDGVLQKVTAFSLIDIPVALSDRPLFVPQDIEPDVRSNATGPEGRLYVLVLDDINTDATRTNRVRAAAKQFIERNMGANDLAAVIHTSGRADGSQDFTSSRRLLTQAVDRFMGRKLRSATLNRIDMYNLTRGGVGGATATDPEQAERLFKAEGVLMTIGSLADWLAGVHGRRKAVVFFSEGIDYNIWDTMGAGGVPLNPADAARRGDGTILISRAQDAIAAATRANVNIYAIDPRGLTMASEDTIDLTGVPIDADSLGLGVAALQDELRDQQQSLRTLAEETGGFASVSSNDFTGAFRRIVDENSSYYVLGYYATNEKRDGRFRKIEVRLRRPGVSVVARKGYVAPKGKPAADKKADANAPGSKELRDAVNSPLQLTGLKLAVFAAPLKGTAQKATVAVVTQFLGKDLSFTPKAGKFANVLEMSYSAVNKQGKVAGGKRDSVDLALRPETHARVQESGVRVQASLELPPGAYQLRVVARQSDGRIGSVHYDLLVPDFAKEPLSISGILLSAASAGAVPTVGAIPELGDALKAPPTTVRTFSNRDELLLLAEVYDNQGTVGHSVDITTSLKAEGRVRVFTNSETRSSKELGGASGGYGYTNRVPLTGLEPGLYVLTVEARSTLKGAATVSRDVQIRIVP
jgi:VWFA-related protein